MTKSYGPDIQLVGTGFARLTLFLGQRRRRISMANQADHKTSHHADHGSSQHTRQSEASAKGQKGVSQEEVGSGKEHDPNNFANNPGRASAAGRKGGQHSHDRD
jgi:general stress protein YciG